VLGGQSATIGGPHVGFSWSVSGVKDMGMFSITLQDGSATKMERFEAVRVSAQFAASRDSAEMRALLESPIRCTPCCGRDCAEYGYLAVSMRLKDTVPPSSDRSR